MCESKETERRRYLFLLARPGEPAAKVARDYLREIGVQVTLQHGEVALVGLATLDQVEVAQVTGLFATVTAGPLREQVLEKLQDEQRDAVQIWNTRQSAVFLERSKNRTDEGKSWGDKEKDHEPPHTRFDPRDFKRELLRFLDTEEEALLDKYRDRKPLELEGDAFIEYERRLEKVYSDATLAYHLSRLAYHLGDRWPWVILELPRDFIIAFFLEAACWRLEREIAVGVVFVESSREGGPQFSSSTRNNLRAEICDGLDWVAAEAPTAANLTWVIDWQYIRIDVANGTNSSEEDYWRNPAMAQLSYNGHTYSADWASVAEYREHVRVHNLSAHALVIFVTPYANKWHAYAGSGRVTLANRNNWGGWGIGTIDRITAHEVCHLFGAADEYTGSGTPCSSCASLHGCDTIPNGNCGSCARPPQACVMSGNQRRLCPWTQGHIGWADVFVALTTANEFLAGTDDTVRLDIGDRTFVLDTPNHDDRERDNVDGYPLKHTGVIRDEVKRVGIRKSSDGFAGGWKLRRVRLWVRGELLCDANNINQWLEDEYRWWASSTCGFSTDIVNTLQVQVTTADVAWAGTDDDVTFYMGGRSWNLDNSGHNDFERGNTDTFNLDPGVGLYRSALGAIRIHKSPDGLAGGWKLKGLRITVNGVQIYNNQSINKWLEDSDRDWYGSI
jgi:hypothetical protein